MKHDPNWQLLLHHWNRLTPFQRRKIALTARLWVFQRQFYKFVITVFFIVAWFITPIPRRLVPIRSKAHWL